MRLRRLFVLVVALLSSAVRAEDCGVQDGYDWRIQDCPTGGGTTGWQPSHQAALDICVTRYAAKPKFFNVAVLNYCSSSSGGYCTYGKIEYDYCWSGTPADGGCNHYSNTALSYSKVPGSIAPVPCPENVDCADLPDSEKRYIGSGAAIDGGLLCLPSTDSDGVSGDCQYSYSSHVGVSGATFSLLSPLYVATGQGCAVPVEPDSAFSDVGESQVTGCALVSGDRVCIDTMPNEPANCGEFNGNRVCLDSVLAGRCILFGNGDVACSSSADQPDTGDGVTPATPEAVLSVADAATGGPSISSTVNIYSNSTAAQSSEPVVGDAASGAAGDGQTGAGSSSGDCDETICGDNSGPGLPQGPNSLGPVTDAPGYGESLQAFGDGVAALVGVGAVSDVSGSCPSDSFELWGESFSFWPTVCSVFDSVAATLSVVMLGVYGLYSVRIILSA